MIVEHEFVTTLDQPEALRRASEFLAQRGFVAQTNGTADSDRSPPLVFARGRAKPQKVQSLVELPQRVEIGWDRGRVTVAAAIDAVSASFTIGTTNSIAPESRKARLHVGLLNAIAIGLESLLAAQATPAEAGAMWDAVERAAAEEVRKRRRRRWILGFTLLALFACCFGLAILSAIFN